MKMIYTSSRAFFSLVLTVTVIAYTSLLATSANAEGKRVFFKAPANNTEVKNPISIEMGVEGMMVKAAGELVLDTGHHHLIIDGQPEPTGTVVPADETHIHYGKGQTSTEITLPEGTHTLTLQFADGIHRSYGPEMSSTITVKVIK